MSIARLLMIRIGHFLRSIAALCSRVLCIFRKRDNIGELPYTVAVNRNSSEDVPYTAQTPLDNAGWDNQWDQRQTLETKIEQWRNTKIAPAPQPEQQEPDFFNDMQPEIKKAKKVILKPKITAQDSMEKRNIFSYESEIAVAPATSELGELDDAQPAWDDDISSTLQEHRLEKHRARQEQHGKRLMEKKAQRESTGYY